MVQSWPTCWAFVVGAGRHKFKGAQTAREAWWWSLCGNGHQNAVPLLPSSYPHLPAGSSHPLDEFFGARTLSEVQARLVGGDALVDDCTEAIPSPPPVSEVVTSVEAPPHSHAGASSLQGSASEEVLRDVLALASKPVSLPAAKSTSDSSFSNWLDLVDLLLTNSKFWGQHPVPEPISQLETMLDNQVQLQWLYCRLRASITGTDLQSFVTGRLDDHSRGWELLADIREHVSPSSPEHLIKLFGDWTSLWMGRNETVRAYTGCMRLLVVALNWAGQKFTAVIQALCFIWGLDMQRFHPFYMTYIMRSRSISSSLLKAVAREVASFYTAHGGRRITDLSKAKQYEVSPESLSSSYPWYGMAGKSAHLAKALYALYKCPVCCINAHALAKCPHNPNKSEGSGGGGGGGAGSGNNNHNQDGGSNGKRSRWCRGNDQDRSNPAPSNPPLCSDKPAKKKEATLGGAQSGASCCAADEPAPAATPDPAFLEGALPAQQAVTGAGRFVTSNPFLALASADDDVSVRGGEEDTSVFDNDAGLTFLEEEPWSSGACRRVVATTQASASLPDARSCPVSPSACQLSHILAWANWILWGCGKMAPSTSFPSLGGVAPCDSPALLNEMQFLPLPPLPGTTCSETRHSCTHLVPEPPPSLSRINVTMPPSGPDVTVKCNRHCPHCSQCCVRPPRCFLWRCLGSSQVPRGGCATCHWWQCCSSSSSSWRRSQWWTSRRVASLGRHRGLPVLFPRLEQVAARGTWLALSVTSGQSDLLWPRWQERPAQTAAAPTICCMSGDSFWNTPRSPIASSGARTGSSSRCKGRAHTRRSSTGGRVA